MFSEEKCPNCGCADYETKDFTEDFWDNGITREWACQCTNCKSNFIIIYYYEMVRTEVSAS